MWRPNNTARVLRLTFYSALIIILALHRPTVIGLSMDIGSLLAFAAGMTLLAVSPGPGLAAVLSRSMVSGIKSGAMVVLGLVIVDFLFLGLAVIGMSAIATVLGPLFQFVKYGAALYLIWLGYQTFKAAGKIVSITPATATSYVKDIGLGAMVTLGNPKAILFYSAFLPTFFNVSQIQLVDLIAICAVIFTISFLVYGTYMLLVGRVRRTFGSTKLQKRVHQTTGVVFIGSGVVVALR